MNKSWRYYCYFMITLFFVAIFANLFNANFFWGHQNQVIQKLSINFFLLSILDLSLVVLHYIFIVESKTPSRWWQVFVTGANVAVAVANITLLIR